MNVDILAQDNYLLVNRKLAEFFGIAEAVYLAELFSICKKAVNKKSFNVETGFFHLDRKYIMRQTTVAPDKQCEYDAKFQSAGLLEVDSANLDMIRIDMGKIVSLIIGTDVKNLASVIPPVKQDAATKKEIKKASIIQMLKNSVSETDPEVAQAYKDWIDSCYGKVTTKAQVKVFIEAVNNYTNDKEVKLDLIKIGIANQYREFTWCAQIYEKSSVSKNRPNNRQKVATKLSEIKF